MMMILVIGGSGSGKSSYAEHLACTLAETDNTAKYYIATMQVFDNEGMRKVERHRTLRDGKGFLTIEQPDQIENAIYKMTPGKRTALLECISNLAANEMFAQAEPKTEQKAAENIIRGMERFKKETTHLIIVSNNVFEDGNIYAPDTMKYINVMGKINQALADLADRVVETVVGIPLYIKR